MSNPDRVVKVGQIWKCVEESTWPIRALVVIITLGSENFATLRARDGGTWWMRLRNDGTPKYDRWIRVSHPKPKVDAAAVERERIAMACERRANDIRDEWGGRGHIAHANAMTAEASWLTSEAKWIREGAK